MLMCLVFVFIVHTSRLVCFFCNRIEDWSALILLTFFFNFICFRSCSVSFAVIVGDSFVQWFKLTWRLFMMWLYVTLFLLIYHYLTCFEIVGRIYHSDICLDESLDHVVVDEERCVEHKYKDELADKCAFVWVVEIRVRSEYFDAFSNEVVHRLWRN